MTRKRILCLANSKKFSGRCIAGREIVSGEVGGWIRPISARASEEVSEYERNYQDGTDPRVLDIVDIPVVNHKPHACQTENWVIEAEEYWILAGRAGWNDALGLAESPEILWHDGVSTYHGLNDEIPQSIADKLSSSLRLIHVGAVQLRVFAPGADFGNPKRRVQTSFAHQGTSYKIWTTDPIIERTFLGQPNGTYNLGESLLCISLSEPMQKKDGGTYRYKLVAAIIPKNPITP